MLVGGLRALMVQALHPLTMAAVADHSDYKSDVWGRFDRTSGYVMTTIYGDTAAARELGANVRAVHRPVRGVDRVTGRPYSAFDRTLLLWIHCTLVESFLAAHRRYVGRVPAGVADRYVSEMVRQAELVGLRAEDVPSTEAANSAFIASQVPELVLTEPAREALETFLDPPLSALRRPYWWAATTAAIALLPPYALELYGLKRPAVRGALLAPVVRAGSRLIRSVSAGPPVLQEAKRLSAAAGHPL